MKNLKLGVAAVALTVALPMSASALTILDGNLPNFFAPSAQPLPLAPGDGATATIDLEPFEDINDSFPGGIFGSLRATAPLTITNGGVTFIPFRTDDEIGEEPLNTLEVAFSVNGTDPSDFTDLPITVVPVGEPADPNGSANAVPPPIDLDTDDILTFRLTGQAGPANGNTVSFDIQSIAGDTIDPPLIPVPPALALLASGAVGLFMVGRRRSV